MAGQGTAGLVLGEAFASLFADQQQQAVLHAQRLVASSSLDTTELLLRILPLEGGLEAADHLAAWRARLLDGQCSDLQDEGIAAVVPNLLGALRTGKTLAEAVAVQAAPIACELTEHEKAEFGDDAVIEEEQAEDEQGTHYARTVTDKRGYSKRMSMHTDYTYDESEGVAGVQERQATTTSKDGFTRRVSMRVFDGETGLAEDGDCEALAIPGQTVAHSVKQTAVTETLEGEGITVSTREEDCEKLAVDVATGKVLSERTEHTKRDITADVELGTHEERVSTDYAEKGDAATLAPASGNGALAALEDAATGALGGGMSVYADGLASGAAVTSEDGESKVQRVGRIDAVIQSDARTGETTSHETHDFDTVDQAGNVLQTGTATVRSAAGGDSSISTHTFVVADASGVVESGETDTRSTMDESGAILEMKHVTMTKEDTRTGEVLAEQEATTDTVSTMDGETVTTNRRVLDALAGIEETEETTETNVLVGGDVVTSSEKSRAVYDAATGALLDSAAATDFIIDTEEGERRHDFTRTGADGTGMEGSSLEYVDANGELRREENVRPFLPALPAAGPPAPRPRSAPGAGGGAAAGRPDEGETPLFSPLAFDPSSSPTRQAPPAAAGAGVAAARQQQHTSSLPRLETLETAAATSLTASQGASTLSSTAPVDILSAAQPSALTVDSPATAGQRCLLLPFISSACPDTQTVKAALAAAGMVGMEHIVVLSARPRDAELEEQLRQEEKRPAERHLQIAAARRYGTVASWPSSSLVVSFALALEQDEIAFCAKLTRALVRQAADERLCELVPRGITEPFAG